MATTEIGRAGRHAPSAGITEGSSRAGPPSLVRPRDAYAIGLGLSVLILFLVAFLGAIFGSWGAHDVDRATAAADAARWAPVYGTLVATALTGVVGFALARILVERRPRTARAWAAFGFAVVAGHARTGWP